MPKEERRKQEIMAFVDHIDGLYAEDNLRVRESRMVKVSHALRKSQELSPDEMVTARDLLESRKWGELKMYLEWILREQRGGGV